MAAREYNYKLCKRCGLRIADKFKGKAVGCSCSFSKPTPQAVAPSHVVTSTDSLHRNIFCSDDEDDNEDTNSTVGAEKKSTSSPRSSVRTINNKPSQSNLHKLSESSSSDIAQIDGLIETLQRAKQQKIDHDAEKQNLEVLLTQKEKKISMLHEQIKRNDSEYEKKISDAKVANQSSNGLDSAETSLNTFLHLIDDSMVKKESNIRARNQSVGTSSNTSCNKSVKGCNFITQSNGAIIEQHNKLINGSTGTGAIREIKVSYDSTKNSFEFFFNSVCDSSGRFDSSAPPSWKLILPNGPVHGVLMGLGNISGSTFALQIGAKCEYIIGEGHQQYKYECVVVIPPTTKNPSHKDVCTAMMFEEDYIHVKESQIDDFIQHLSSSPINESKKVPSPLLAKIATHFSSFGSGIQYSPTKTEIWIKPRPFLTFLQVAKSRGYDQFRLVMHGSTSDGYESIFNDAGGFDIGNNKNGRMAGIGIYTSATDHACQYYNFACSKYPNGSAILGVYLYNSNDHPNTVCSNTTAKSSNQSVQPYNYDVGMCGNFRTCYPSIMNNGIVIRDPSYFLPLGVAVAN